MGDCGWITHKNREQWFLQGGGCLSVIRDQFFSCFPYRIAKKKKKLWKQDHHELFTLGCSLHSISNLFTGISPEALQYPQWLSVNTWWSSILKPDVEVAKISIHPSFPESECHKRIPHCHTMCYSIHFLSTIRWYSTTNATDEVLL